MALLWLYISNMAILLGALFNAERQRALQGLSEREPLDIDLRDPKGKEILSWPSLKCPPGDARPSPYVRGIVSGIVQVKGVLGRRRAVL